MIVCPNCYCRFEPEDNPVIPGLKQAGALTGAAIGARIGIIAGPIGGVAGAVIGGLLADNYQPKSCKCPCCDEIIDKQ